MSCFTRLLRRCLVRESGAEKDQTTTASSHGTNAAATAQSAPRAFPGFTFSLPGLSLFLFTRNFANKTFFASQQDFPIADLRSAGLTFDNMSLSDQSINMATTNDDQEPPHKKQKREVVECRICRNDIDGDDYLRPCRGCKTIYCYACVGKRFETALGDQESFPARCCGRVFYHRLAEGILKPADLKRYEARFDENSTPNPIYCPVPTCSTFIPARVRQVVNDKLTCPACGCEACIKCKNVASDGHDCSRDEFEKITKKFGYKMCPRCGTGVARMYGCAHMQCHCGAHWCWHCRRPQSLCEVNGCDQRWDEEEGGGDRPEDEDDAAEGEAQPDTEPVVAVTATADPNTTESATAATQPAAAGSATNAEATTTVPVATDPNNDTSTRSTEPTAAFAAATDPAAPASRPSTEAETFVNLDDPEAFDWEGMDLELNDEPEYDDPSFFGCHHHFREFGVDAMPDKWLLGLNKLKGVKLECMACFKPIKVPGTLAKEKESKKKNKANKKMLLAYDCEHCAIIVCWGCKEEAEQRAKEA